MSESTDAHTVYYEFLFARMFDSRRRLDYLEQQPGANHPNSFIDLDRRNHRHLREDFHRAAAKAEISAADADAHLEARLREG